MRATGRACHLGALTDPPGAVVPGHRPSLPRRRVVATATEGGAGQAASLIRDTQREEAGRAGEKEADHVVRWTQRRSQEQLAGGGAAVAAGRLVPDGQPLARGTSRASSAAPMKGET